jgi:ribosomal protein S18 acetylase RimI-like enzyme
MTGDDTTHPSKQQVLVLRAASPHDLGAIASLHADSWRRHYRGAYRDEFLDGDLVADRQVVWSERLMAQDAHRFTLVAEHNSMVVGFIHMILDEDPQWGTLLDNLHVTYQFKRGGIGRRLLSEAACELAQRRPNGRRFYLWVLDQNTAAQAFYVACGGRKVETILGGPFPGGGQALCHRMAWPDAAVLGSLLSGSK